MDVEGFLGETGDPAIATIEADSSQEDLVEITLFPEEDGPIGR